MLHIHRLERYKDDQGNEVVYDGEILDEKIDIRFEGSNNKLIVSPKADIKDLLVTFGGDNGQIEIGPTTRRRTGLRFELSCGHESRIRVGEDVGCAGRVLVSAVEGASVSIGFDVMFARNVELRGDDNPPIFDVRTGKRLNPSQPIVVGDHVWIAKSAALLSGAAVGNGSVVGFRSTVTSSIPNNCIAVGAPARVVRRDIAWERPEVMPRLPKQENPRKGEKSPRYWNLTEVPAAPPVPVHPLVRLRLRLRAAASPRRLARHLPAPVKRLVRRLRS